MKTGIEVSFLSSLSVRRVGTCSSWCLDCAPQAGSMPRTDTKIGTWSRHIVSSLINSPQTDSSRIKHLPRSDRRD